ncbi:MAG: hypothetical protein IKT08_08500 [Bacteroidales bacterium]|nr:hypothetical protein [Bacteroidales bacterium]
MNEINTFSALHENMQAILGKPANYTEKITRFLAGGLGACGYLDDITVGELAKCWQHEEYHIKCLGCKEDAYITFWAGKANNPGYWEIKAYCPHCGQEYRYYDMYVASAAHHVHWTTMRKILEEERETIKNETNMFELVRIVSGLENFHSVSNVYSYECITKRCNIDKEVWMQYYKNEAMGNAIFPVGGSINKMGDVPTILLHVENADKTYNVFRYKGVLQIDRRIVGNIRHDILLNIDDIIIELKLFLGIPLESANEKLDS